MIEFNTQDTEYLIPGPAGLLQCKARAGVADKSKDGAPIVILCHPHPLFEGTMDNKVITTLARVFRDHGISQLRFNFRGVGKSQGQHADMLGESEDLIFLMDLLAEKLPGQKFVLAGFSFGSGVASLAAQKRTDIERLLLVAPPNSKYGSAYLTDYPCPVSIYQGGEDDVVEPKLVRSWASRIQTESKLYWFDGVGHFFHGKLLDLSKAVQAELIEREVF